MGQANNQKGLYPLNETNAPLLSMRIAASQTITKGDAVILSSGKIAIGLAGSAELCGVAAETKTSGGTVADSDRILVWWNSDTIFRVRADGDTSAVTEGTARDIIGATGAMELDADAAATSVLVIVSKEYGGVDFDATAAGHYCFVKINKHAFADTST